jgi:hypothetical protein
MLKVSLQVQSAVSYKEFLTIEDGVDNQSRVEQRYCSASKIEDINHPTWL